MTSIPWLVRSPRPVPVAGCWPLLAALPLGGVLAAVGAEEAGAERPLDRLRRRTQQRNRKQRNTKKQHKKNKQQQPEQQNNKQEQQRWRP